MTAKTPSGRSQAAANEGTPKSKRLASSLGLADARLAGPMEPRVLAAQAELLRLLERGDYYEAYQRLLRSKPKPKVLKGLPGSLGAVGTLAKNIEARRRVEQGIAVELEKRRGSVGRPRNATLVLVKKIVGWLELKSFSSRFGNLDTKAQLAKLAEVISAISETPMSDRERREFVKLVYDPVLRQRKTPVN